MEGISTTKMSIIVWEVFEKTEILVEGGHILFCKIPSSWAGPYNH
jgi:hypothetical protein